MDNIASPSVREVYNLLDKNRHQTLPQYHVDNTYLDPRRMKEDKQYFQESMKPPKSSPLKPVRHKSSYLDQVQKHSKAIPAPNQYQHNLDEQAASKMRSKSSVTKRADRHTIFQELQKHTRKDNFPSAATYSVNPEKDKHKSNLSKGHSPNYLEASMRNSIDTPGVGQYNGKDLRGKWEGKVVKWKEGKNASKKDPNKEKLPPVGTYTPHPVAYELFQSIDANGKKRKASLNGFGKTERFAKFDPKKQPKGGDYNLIAEWGVKDRIHKKSLLDKVSKSGQRSVYY